MERAVRMIFRNVMFDTWVDGGNGMMFLRPQILALVQRLALEPVTQMPELSEQAGLMTVHCKGLTADTETLRHEKGCAIFSIRADGRPGPGIPFADGSGANLTPQEPERVRTLPVPERSAYGLTSPSMPESASGRNRQRMGPDRASAVPQGSGTDKMILHDDVGPLFGSTSGPAPQTFNRPSSGSGSPGYVQAGFIAGDDKGEILETAPVGLRRWAETQTGNILEREGDDPPPEVHPKKQLLVLAPLNSRGRALPYLKANLQVAGSVHEGFSNEAGNLCFIVPPHCRAGRLTLFLSDEPGHNLCWPIRFQPMAGIETLAGVRSRLHLLGFETGSLEERFDVGLALALQRFQEHMGLAENDGGLDLETRTCLSSLFPVKEILAPLESRA